MSTKLTGFDYSQALRHYSPSSVRPNEELDPKLSGELRQAQLTLVEARCYKQAIEDQIHVAISDVLTRNPYGSLALFSHYMIESDPGLDLGEYACLSGGTLGDLELTYDDFEDQNQLTVRLSPEGSAFSFDAPFPFRDAVRAFHNVYCDI